MNPETVSCGGLPLAFAAGDREAAARIGRACERSVGLIARLWGLAPPPGTRVEVSTSWRGAVFHCAAWPWRPLLALSLPLWGPRARRMWSMAGGWTLRLGARTLVAVKPPRLVQSGDSRLGARIFVSGLDPEFKSELVACHELTHACTAPFHLPAWLNEGLAMVAADAYAGAKTVRSDTAAALAAAPAAPGSRRTPRLRPDDADAFVALYVRGYWRVRLLEETRPGLLRDLLAERRPGRWPERIAAALSLDPARFDSELDALAVARFASPPSGS